MSTLSITSTTTAIGSPVSAGSNRQGKAVVIVDDSALISKKITELIENESYVGTITACSSYTQAIEAIEHIAPAVVLLDINLPGKSGIDVLKYIKQHRIDTRVIMVTNQSQQHYKKLCYQLGAYAFVDKSGDFHTIPDLIAAAI